MTYMDKNAELKRGYNVYIDADADDFGTLMDVGLLVMEEGDSFTIEEPEKECAVLLFGGKADIAWGERCVEAEQDPAKADPLEYAIKGRRYIREHTGL